LHPAKISVTPSGEDQQKLFARDSRAIFDRASAGRESKMANIMVGGASPNRQLPTPSANGSEACA
jgi:hypothetical protein